MLGVVELMEIEVKLLLVLKYFGVSINGDGENCKFYKGVGEIIVGYEYCGVDESEGGIFALYSLLCRHEKVNLLPNQLRSDARISSFRLKMSSPELESSLEIKERLEASVTLKKLFLMLIFPSTSIVIADGVVISAMSVMSIVGGLKFRFSGVKQGHGMASLTHLTKNINAAKIDSVVLGMDENEMSIKSIDRNNDLQVIEQILEAEITEPSKIKRVRQKKKRILDVNTTLLRHNASLNEVTTYEKAHSCLVDFITFDHMNATSKVICDYILELVRDSSNVITPNFMVDEIRKKYGIIISYNEGWRAIQHAYTVIRGTAEENYNRFQYAFFFYGTSIIGWANYRPVIMVDATFLKAKYRGVLMIAVSKEGKNNIFSLAFGIADSENNESYNWFFNKLRHAIGVREQLSILSDHHPAIANAIANVYPECQHGIFIYHIERYLRKRYFSDVVLSLFYNAATTYKQIEFYTFMDEIEKVDKVAAAYLKEV
ncbi:putative potassium transporter 14 [Capsicum baccatum]|uniref:Potassium transporter 14 n=1 Tax=Capsicum baccatum TaxID=33114 RepID=A0A2G2WB80_CAPBA|nr:putative potassium transporter 14 [Capsicum baccatum]